MNIQHDSRKQRQLKYLVKKLNVLLQKSEEKLESEINNLISKIKYLASQLNGIISANRMRKILGTVALLIGLSFTNTANAQWFAYPIQDPFNLQDGNDEDIISPEFADLDNDGDLDYLSGEYSYTGLGYGLGFRYQENIGSATSPNFANAVINPFGLTDYSLTFPEIGIRQHHKFIDIDNDGDFDILSNVLSINYNTQAVKTDFLFYENIGTPSNPIFTAPTLNQFGLSTSPNTIDYTTLGDIDGDGDTDILGFSFDYSTYAANFLFIENIGSASVPNFTTPQLNVFGIPSGIFSMLALEDIDTDGDLDILFTQENYYSTDFGYVENTGTASIPQYNPPPTVNQFGLSFPNWQGGGILNFKDLDGDGDNDLIVGTDDDFISYLENVGVQQPVTYECINYSCVDPGTGSGTYATLSSCQTSCIAPVTYDCDWPGNCYDPGDGNGYYATYSDCMLDCTPSPSWDCISPGNCQDPGDGSGWYWSLQDCQNDCAFPATWNCDASLGCIDPADGTGLYASLSGCQANCNTTSVISTEINNLKLFPNPVNNTLHISFDKKIDKIEIFDNLGRIILSKNNPESKINVEHLANGIYSIAIIFDENRIIKKFTK
jgi:hypothetical protein